MMKTKMRNGIAMIELIFAIVVMGIVLMSAPMLISTSAQGSLVAVQQEAIAASSSELGMILTRDWDEAGTDETAEGPILIVSATGHSDLEMVLTPDGNSSGRRAGTPIASTRKSFSSTSNTEIDATLAAAFNEGDDDDIDDFNGDVITLTGIRYAFGDLADATISINTNVTYISDTPSAGSYNSTTLTLNNPFDATETATTNIKSITAQTTSTNLDTSIRLQAFSCNIGTYTLKTRSF